jgi:RNA polymerase sigma-70 factor (ECF subfamily)
LETSLTLLERLATQPTDADWQRLADVYQPLLHAWLRRADVPASDRDDLVQEVLLVMFREVPTFEPRKPGGFRAWLKTILLLRLRQYFRDRGRRPAAPGGSAFLERLGELESPMSDLSRLWDREHDEYLAARMIERVRGDFTSPTWKAFQRYVLEGAPAAEVAAELGLSLNSILLAKSRVLKRLRQELHGLVE